MATRTDPIARDKKDAPRDGWDDPVRGRIHWQTLFLQRRAPETGGGHSSGAPALRRPST
jgi:hypothetical protein